MNRIKIFRKVIDFHLMLYISKKKKWNSYFQLRHIWVSEIAVALRATNGGRDARVRRSVLFISQNSVKSSLTELATVDHDARMFRPANRIIANDKID